MTQPNENQTATETRLSGSPGSDIARHGVGGNRLLGGVDSALLAVVAHRVLGSSALAVTAISPALAARDLGDAERVAGQFGINHRVIRTAELEREGYVANTPMRCYFCKTELYDQLGVVAADERIGWIANGANTDDLGIIVLA